jgi:hypothetical protein
MSKNLKIVLAGLIILVLGAGLVYTGIWSGGYGLNPFVEHWSIPGWGMMSGWRSGTCGGSNSAGGYGVMDGFNNQGSDTEPLSIHEVEDILDAYLEDAADTDLVLSEIMIFDNHAYAQILEESTGIGAMEVLVDYQSGEVYPEHGPNMMWNLKYSHMAGGGTFRGPGMMMGRGSSYNNNVDLEDFTDMPVSSDQAVFAAQEYLDMYQPGIQADDHAVMFYGYFTLHTLDGNEVDGMLSVNGYTGQVFYHDWHGKLLETDDH